MASWVPRSTGSASCEVRHAASMTSVPGLGKELSSCQPKSDCRCRSDCGQLEHRGVPHLGKVRVTAGAAKLLDVAEINDALVQAGQATIKGTIKTGRNRVRAESERCPSAWLMTPTSLSPVSSARQDQLGGRTQRRRR